MKRELEQQKATIDQLTNQNKDLLAEIESLKAVTTVEIEALRLMLNDMSKSGQCPNFDIEVEMREFRLRCTKENDNKEIHHQIERMQCRIDDFEMEAVNDDCDLSLLPNEGLIGQTAGFEGVKPKLITKLFDPEKMVFDSVVPSVTYDHRLSARLIEHKTVEG